MAPFRPTNLNKRYYPGNASVVGPTRTPTLGITTTTCCSSTNVCAACCCQPLCLGCRCSFCGCPCCNICCSCPCTVCTQTVPSGKWSKWEQYEASSRNAWGSGSTSSTGAATCLCCTGVGFICISNVTDCGGFFICCGPSTNKWFVAPSCTEVNRNWHSRANAVTVANSCMGSCGWFVPTLSQLQNPGGTCSVYWDCVTSGGYWSNSNNPHNGKGCYVHSLGGPAYQGHSNNPKSVRAFRCTAT